MNDYKMISGKIAEHISTAEILSTERAAVDEVGGTGTFCVRLYLHGFSDRELADMVAQQINDRLHVCSRTVIDRAKEILNTASIDILA